ncbi:MAG: UDP-N-acetyl glucosamine 2-epimerase [Betaproteobacteria bacterium]
MTVVGTRPEIIRLSRVIAKLEALTDHVLVHTGQNYDYTLNEVFFRDLRLPAPDHYLDAAGATPIETIGNTLMRLDRVIEAENPEALLVLGDTNSCLSVITAKRRKVPVFHMEAGNRCFDERVPEEINRRLVDHLSDINLPYSDRARDLLIREGLPPDRVIKTGSPMYEVLHAHLDAARASTVRERLGLEAKEYYVASVHREENVDAPDRLAMMVATLNAVAARHGRRVVVSTHPRTRNRLAAAGLVPAPLVEFHDPFGYLDYLKLQMDSAAVLSDSGTISEEAAVLDLRALNLRDAHERPEGMEEAVVIMTGLGRDRVLQGLEILEASPREGRARFARIPLDYEVPNVSDKIVRIILSYVDYVNRVVWRRY